MRSEQELMELRALAEQEQELCRSITAQVNQKNDQQRQRQLAKDAERSKHYNETVKAKQLKAQFQKWKGLKEQVVKQLKQEQERELDYVKMFLEQNFEVRLNTNTNTNTSTDKSKRVPAKALYEEYLKWCIAQHKISIDKYAFGRRLKQHGVTSTRHPVSGVTAIVYTNIEAKEVIE